MGDGGSIEIYLPMTIIRRRPAPLPPSVRVYPEVPWVDPSQTAPPWWRRVLSAAELLVLVLVLGVVLTLAIGVVFVASFFAFDLLIS